jgi:putative pyruvate formate lyase activating enzyme
MYGCTYMATSDRSSLIDRETELRKLRSLIDAGEPRLALLTSRRRVGKTFLLRSAWGDERVFFFAAPRQAGVLASAGGLDLAGRPPPRSAAMLMNRTMTLSRRAFLRAIAGDAAALVAAGTALGQGAWAADDDEWRPAYLQFEEEGRFAARIDEAYAILEHCQLCPRRCGVNRLRGQTGVCRTADQPVVFSAQPHYGEELPLVGRYGSGTIFFSNCNLRCVFCQNWPIAHEGRGHRIEVEELANLMLAVQGIGCHNINLVTPTHVMPQILRATRIAASKGLRIPLCYNTGGYDSLQAIRLLDGIVDIYLPDLKFMDADQAEVYMRAPDYPETARAAIAEMHRQVGELVTDDRGIALRGLMIRHLVMPNGVSNPRAFVHWVAETLTASTYVNIMSQYRVDHMAFEYPEIARAITIDEFLDAMGWAEEAGLTNLDERSLMQRDLYRRRHGG